MVIIINSDQSSDGPQREHLAAVVGIHPLFSTLCRYLPDPFFIRGHRSSSGLSNMARQRVTKRVESREYRSDILGKLIQARQKDTGKDDLTEEQLEELIAETVTLL